MVFGQFHWLFCDLKGMIQIHGLPCDVRTSCDASRDFTKWRHLGKSTLKMSNAGGAWTLKHFHCRKNLIDIPCKASSVITLMFQVRNHIVAQIVLPHLLTICRWFCTSRNTTEPPNLPSSAQTVAWHSRSKAHYVTTPWSNTLQTGPIISARYCTTVENWRSTWNSDIGPIVWPASGYWYTIIKTFCLAQQI